MPRVSLSKLVLTCTWVAIYCLSSDTQLEDSCDLLNQEEELNPLKNPELLPYMFLECNMLD